MATVDELKYIINAEDGNFTAAISKVVDTHKKTAKVVEKPLKFNIDTARLNKGLKAVRDIGVAFIGIREVARTVFGSVRRIAAFTVETAKLAGVVENLTKAFDKLAKGEGLDARNLLNELQAATEGTVSNIELLRNATQARFLGVDLRNLPTLFEFATIRARETGQSVDFLVQSIVTGIGRRSILILDNLGITMRQLNAEMERIAKEQEVWNGRIDENIRTLTFQEAAVAVATKGIETAAKQSENAASALDQLNASWQNFLVTIGQQTSGPVASVINDLRGLIQIFDDFITVTGQAEESSKAAKDLAEGIKAVADESAKAVKPLETTASSMEFIKNSFIDAGPIFALIAAAMVGINEAGNLVERQFTDLGEAAENIRNPLLAPKEALDELSNSLNRFGQDITDLSEDLKDLGGAVSEQQLRIIQKQIKEQERLEDFLFRSNRISLEDYKQILEQRLVLLRANTDASVLEVGRAQETLRRVTQQLFEGALEDDPVAEIRQSSLDTLDIVRDLSQGLIESSRDVDQARRESNDELQAAIRDSHIETAEITLSAISGVLTQISGQTQGVINQILRLIATVTRALAAFQAFRAATFAGAGSFLPVIGPAVGVIGAIGGLLGLGKLTGNTGISGETLPGGGSGTAGAASTPLGQPQNNLLASLAPQQQESNEAQLQQNNRELIEAIQGIRIEINSELDAIRFFRRNFPKFQKAEREISL